MKKTTQTQRRLILLDMHAILHRAYHALPDFATSKGEPTGGIYGLVAMLLKIIAELKPDAIVACYDLQQKTYRHEAYTEYKAGRKATDDNLSIQIQKSHEVLEVFGIPEYSTPGFEADDCLGTIVEQVLGNDAYGDVDVVIASGDMDTLQLVTGSRVQVYTLKKGIQDTILYNEAAVVDRFGFSPTSLPDYKGLRGDPSDNIPGIRGVGEKTATSLIVEFKTIEQIYDALSKGEDERFKKIGLTPRLKEIVMTHQDDAIFSKMLGTIRRDAPIQFVMPSPWSGQVDFARIEKLFRDLEFRTLAARFKDTLSKAYSTASVSSEGEAVSEYVEPAPAKRTGTTDVWNQAILLLWLIDSNTTNPSIDDVVHHTGISDAQAARDALLAELSSRGERAVEVYTNIEQPLMQVVERMNGAGVKVDLDRLTELSKKYHTDLDALAKEIQDMAGEEFNINSPRQLGDILFTKLGLKGEKGSRQKKTAGGALSTKESELEKLIDAHPIVAKVLAYREVQKLLSTYIDVIPTLVAADGRLHATFLQTGTTTGRMASRDPNLQNIPIKTDMGRTIRGAFVAEDGFSLVSLDYSQIELRIAAILSHDEKLISIFKNGDDIHASVASHVFKVPLEEVTKEMRRQAKVINFGILYGMGVSALKQNLGTERAEAQTFYDEYFRVYKQLAEYIEHIKQSAQQTGYTETLFGRRRYFPNITSKLPFIRAAAERMALNAPIQGTQADVIKLASVRIDEYFEKQKLRGDARLIMQIHDELMFEIRDEKIESVVRDIRSIMESVLTEDQTEGVPIIANAAAGKSWDVLTEIPR